MSIQVVSGPARVVGSGSVTAFAGHPLMLTISLEKHVSTVTFEFSSDPSTEDVSVETRWVDEGCVLELVNFDHADGRGSAQPVLLGEVGQALLFLHFRVFRYGKTDDRTLHYTVYTAAKEDVGWQPVDPETPLD